MDIRKLSPDYAVSPQITPDEVAEIAEAGFTTIICNRPDAEVPPGLHSDDVKAAAEAAGLTFVDNPVTHQGLNMGMVETQAAAMQSAIGPVFAYCASGNRSSVIWSLSQAGTLSTGEIMEATRAAGYDLSGLAPQIEALAKKD